MNKKLAARIKELEAVGTGSASSSATKSPTTLVTVDENPEAKDAKVSKSQAEEKENPDVTMEDADKAAETENPTLEGGDGVADDSSETPTI